MNSRPKLSLELVGKKPNYEENAFHDKILKELSELSPSQVWVFLATHGLWIEDLESEKCGDPCVIVDCLNGTRRLKVSYKNDNLISAMSLIPVFETYVEEISYTRREVENTDQVTPWGIHSKIKKGEILRTEDTGVRFVVTPLTFHAVTCGYHRIGYSYRLAALQSALSKEIAQTLLNVEASSKTYDELHGVNIVEEILGAVTAYLSFIVRYGEFDIKIIEAEMTTSVNPLGRLNPENQRDVVESARKLLCKIFKESKNISIHMNFKNGGNGCSDEDFSIFSSSEDVDRLLHKIQHHLKPFGRLRYMIRLRKEFEEKYCREDIKTILLDFSEQMNPCDLYVLSLLIDQNLGERLSSTWIICTPLTYPLASISALYATQLRSLGQVKLAISSEDPEVAKLLAENILRSEELENRKLLYLAAGPTSHVLSFGKTLMKISGSNVLLDTVSP